MIHLYANYKKICYNKTVSWLSECCIYLSSEKIWFFNYLISWRWFVMKILIVVDMQNDFISGSLGTKEAETIVPNVIDKINKSKGQLILFTKDTHKADYLNTKEGKMLPIEHCIENTEGWYINEDILKAWLNNKNTIVVSNLDNNTFTKNTFGSTHLAQYIKNIEKGIESVEIIGLCTDICVLSNAIIIKAYIPEVEIIVDASCCAGVNPESHNNALKAMKMCHINVVNI